MSITENIALITSNIEAALARRPAPLGTGSTVKLVAVTKNQEAATVRQALIAGATALGENRVQEAAAKAEILGYGPEWHLVGHLQTNKVRQAVALFSLIHSVDSERLAREIDREANRLGKRQAVLIQVNVADEDTKFGVAPAAATDLVRLTAEMTNIRVAGLMTIAPYFDDPAEARSVFRELYSMYMDLKTTQPAASDFEWLSMGMTNDYSVAVEEGANLVRIGTAIFGPRHY